MAALPDGAPLYEVSTCSLDGGAGARPRPASSSLPRAGLEALERADTVVVPGYFALFEPPPAAATTALQGAAARGARVLSVCTGAFALAHAGLLDGRRATTHWGWAAELAARFPAVEVDPDALYVDEGEVMTSAGLSAGIDLALHVIRKDFGAAAGARVARHMVAAAHRDGGQAQFIERPPRLPPTARWSRPGAGPRERLAEPLDVAAMAAPRRRQPAHLRPPLPRGDGDDAAAVAALPPGAGGAAPAGGVRPPGRGRSPGAAGFGTAASLRDHFRRATATTPTAYRRTFRTAAATV